MTDRGVVASADAASIYTCPMHPEVQELAPGICPICGMALEAATISATVEENPELADMTRRFWISLAFTLPVFAAGRSRAGQLKLD